MFTTTTDQKSSYSSFENLQHLLTARTFYSRKSRRRFVSGKVFAVAILVAFFILQTPDAVAGTGTFKDGKFNFCVSIRFVATPTQIQRIKDVLQAANPILFDATDGQHQLGTISIINNSGASDQADLWILPSSGRGNASDFGYGIRGRHITLFFSTHYQDRTILDGALTFVHEFGHHAYDLGDEYRKPGPGEPAARCAGDERTSPTLNYCIMDHFIVLNRTVNEFCVDSNHDKPPTNKPEEGNDTAQSDEHNGDACWETMSKLERKWVLNPPSSLPQSAPPSTGLSPVIFNETCTGITQRTVLLFDRSGSMVNQNRFVFAKAGGAGFINNYGIGDFLGIVSFATTASVDFPLTQMNDANRTTARNAVNSLNAVGLTNLGDGLLLAINQLSNSCTDCQKTIILMSDGDSNVGAAPETLITALQNADIKVVSATVGTDISVEGEASLKNISNKTGGNYFRAPNSDGFLHFLVDSAFANTGYRRLSNEPQVIGSNQVKEIPVLVEADAANTSFGIAFDVSDTITLALRKPNGEMITETSAPLGQYQTSSGLKLFKIPTPEAGTWKMVLTSGTINSGNVQLLSYTQHDGTDFWAQIEDDTVSKNEPLILRATPTHLGMNVTGATVTGQVVHPNGTRSTITLFDDGAATHRDQSAADGVYSALFNSYSGFGTYTFNLKYENTSGQTYMGEPLPDENGVVPNFPPTSVPAVTRITSVTAIVSSVTDVVWFDDILPEGATTPNQQPFPWVELNPAAYSGQLSHQSRNFAQTSTVHSHSFEGAARRLTLGSNDKLFTYVFLDVNNMPHEIMLEWKDANGWEHRAYWGQDLILDRGVNGTSSRFFMGPLPKPGHWERLEVWASDLGLVGKTIDGMSFVHHGGRASWDLAGKSAGPGGDFFPGTSKFENIWIDGAVPAGATAATTNDVWNWVPCPTGSLVNLCHESILAPHADPGVGGKLRHHQYTGGPPQYVNKGDVLFAWVFLDDVIMPNQLFLQWHDGTNWRRAYWGTNYQEVGGLTGTENWRYMGGLPTPDKWVRLEVPASYVGLEGRHVTGMSFGFFKEDDNSRILWGRAGKTATLTTAPLVPSNLTRVWSYVHPRLGYYYQVKDVRLHSDDTQRTQHFFAHPNQAAGTVPMYEFINTTKREFFYTTCKTCPEGAWAFHRIAFYVYPHPATPSAPQPPPGTVPLHLYHNSATQYFLTIDPNEAAGRTLDSDHWAWVYPTNPVVPVQPTNLTRSSLSPCRLSWLDNSNNEEGFKIWKNAGAGWNQVATVGANVNTFEDCNIVTTIGDFIVYAFNSVGDSFPSNNLLKSFKKPCKYCIRLFDVDAVSDTPPVSDNPSVNIPIPLEGAVVGRTVAIIGDAFDEDGNGSINKVEFFAGAQKIGEVIGSPFNFTWFNAPIGSHTLTAVARDNAGETGTSAPVHITVSDVPIVTLTSPTNGAVVSGPANVTLQATASDPDGSVAKVEFFSGATKLGEDTTAPYSFAWNNVQSGTYDLTARAIDNLGLAVTSDFVTLTVNTPPSVSLTAPANGLVVLAPANVTLSANAADADGTVTKVDFYAGTTLIGTKTTAPYTYDWTGISYGTYSLTAKVTDNRGTITTSSAVTLIVNSAPSASITSPANQAMLTPSSNVVINATASDPDGSITKVDFYQGTSLIGTDTTSPFSVNWNNVAPGSYVLTAQATDNRGAITTSSAVAVTTPAFFDDFNDNSLNTSKWSVITPSSPVVVSEQGQQLRITLPGSTLGYNGIVSNATFDIRNGTVQVEKIQPVSQAGWVEDHLIIEKDANNYYLLHTGSGSTVLRSMVNGVNDQLIIPYDPVAHHYWRLRHQLASNSVFFETSADGITWTTLKTAAAGFALTAVKFKLNAGAWGTGNANPGAAIYNDFQFIASATALPPACTPTAGLIISEFRLRGPNGSHDEYIELYNNTDQSITVCTADGSSGWAVVSSDGVTQFVLPSGTVVPARSHYLAVAPGYSLTGYAAGDLSYSLDIPENTGLALFNTAYSANFTTANRFDAAGFTSSNSLYREGAGLPLLGANVGEYSFFRKLNSGVSQDTGDNVADFNFVATNGGVYGGLVAILGPPGPENRFSPLQRNATLPVTVLDPAVAASVAPNRVRDTAAVGPNAAFGTLTMRRTVTNNTGANVTKLRFRIIDITTLNTPGYVAGGSQSDMRVLSSTDSMVTVTGGQSVVVRGTTVESPPNQPGGGGLNSSLNVGVISLSQPLAPGQSINVQFVLGVQQTGTFRFFMNVEALP